MKKILPFLFVLVLLAGCLPNPGMTAQPSPTPYPPQPTLTPYPTQPAPATESATPLIPAATLVPTITPMPTSDGQTCISDDSVTNFPERELMVVNDEEVGLQVRDANCPRATFHDETGIALGDNFKLDVPLGWSIAFAAVSCQVHPDGGQPTDYKETPFILVRGPWKGSIGCYEAGVHGLPSEWESYLTTVIKPIHDSEVGHVVPLTIITGE